jgi:MtN3 and saliva related transmembrane protein
MTSIALIGMIAAALTTGAYIPQAWKTIRTRSTKDLSIITFSMLFAGAIMWLIYGLYIHDTPLVLANGITASLSGIIFSIKLVSIKKGKKRE